MQRLIYLLFFLVIIASCNNDQDIFLVDIKEISSDQFEGRKPGSTGCQLARNYILKRVNEIGIQKYNNLFTDTFQLNFVEGILPGVNIQAYQKGKTDKLIVITAHYDHLGIIDGEIYNGANDNATGVSVVLEIMKQLKEYRLNNSILYIFFDAEEFGKQGSKHFLSNNLDIHKNILLNFNIDMLNCRSVSDLYLCGTKQHPKLKDILEPQSDKRRFKFGHDGQNVEIKDWTRSSDHRVFADWGIPYLYFGSEYEAYYNTPNDDFENINTSCLKKTIPMIKEMITELDKNLGQD